MRLPVLVRAILVCFLSASALTAQTTADKAAKAKELLVAMASEPNSLDPQLITSVNEFLVVSSLTEGLVATDPKTGELGPGVAHRWEVKEDGRTFHFHLRPNAKWSNGEPLTADDFVQSYFRALSPKLAADRVDYLFILKGAKDFYEGKSTDPSIVGIRAIDTHTLELVTETPTLRLIPLLTTPFFSPVNTRTIDKHGAREDRMNRWTSPGNHVGNGPFRLVRWDRGKEVLVEKNPHYWDSDNVALNTISFLPFSDRQAEERSFRAGQLHVSLAVPPNRLEYWRENQPEALQVMPNFSIQFMRVNVTKAPLDDIRVRRALSLAIDRTILAEKIVGPLSAPAKRFLPFDRTPPPDAYPVEYDGDKARALLKEAGYPDGNGFPIVTVLLNGNAVNQRVYEAIQQMWKRELGIQVRLRTMEFNVLLQTIDNRDYQIARSGLVGSMIDAGFFLIAISRPNTLGWDDTEFQAERLAGDTTANPAEAERHYHRAERLLLESGALIPLYHEDQAILLSKHVKNFPLVRGGLQLLKTIRLEE